MPTYKSIITSRRPNVLPHPFDPIAQLINARIPILQPEPHAINLLHIQDFRLHPVDPRHLRHLVDAAAQQTETERLHDQDFDFLRLDVRLACDGGECHGAVVRRAAEYGLGEGRQADFLPEEGFVLV